MRTRNGFCTFYLTLYNEFTRPLPPDVTHTLISSFLYISMPGLVAPMLASIRFAPPVPDRQTLRVCGEIAQGPYDCAFDTASRIAKRYMCASNTFFAFVPRRGLLIRTRHESPNVTHVLLFAFPLRFHETLHTHLFLRFLLRHMCLFGPLRTPHVRQCNVWAPPPFQTCFRFACRLAKHQQP
jgi:hypothetical protein